VWSAAIRIFTDSFFVHSGIVAGNEAPLILHHDVGTDFECRHGLCSTRADNERQLELALILDIGHERLLSLLDFKPFTVALRAKGNDDGARGHVSQGIRADGTGKKSKLLGARFRHAPDKKQRCHKSQEHFHAGHFVAGEFAPSRLIARPGLQYPTVSDKVLDEGRDAALLQQPTRIRGRRSKHPCIKLALPLQAG